MQLSDITLYTQDATYGTTIDLLPLCCQKFRETNATRFKFTFVPSKTTSRDPDTFKIEGNRLQKLLVGWKGTFISDRIISKPIQYFEFRVETSDVHGIFVGVTDDANQASFDGYMPINEQTICALYNSPNGTPISDHHVVNVWSTTKTDIGDVLTIVVDRVDDEIRFYRNMVYVGIGNRRPSQFRELYAFASLFYKDQAIVLCERYEYYQLTKIKPLKTDQI